MNEELNNIFDALLSIAQDAYIHQFYMEKIEKTINTNKSSETAWFLNDSFNAHIGMSEEAKQQL